MSELEFPAHPEILSAHLSRRLTLPECTAEDLCDDCLSEAASRLGDAFDPFPWLDWTASAFRAEHEPGIDRATAEQLMEQGGHLARAMAAAWHYLVDILDHAIETLAPLPRGTHLGELEDGFLLESTWLPAQYAHRYGYECLFRLRSTLAGLRPRLERDAADSRGHLTHCVAEDVLLDALASATQTYFYEYERAGVDLPAPSGGDWYHHAHAVLRTMLPERHSDVRELLDGYHGHIAPVWPAEDSPAHFDHWFDRCYAGTEAE